MNIDHEYNLIDENETIVEQADPIDYRLDGTFDVIDLADEIEDLFLNGIEPGISSGYKILDELYTIGRGQWTIVTGSPGAGKSTLIDNILVNVASREGWKFLVCSPENQPIKQHVANLASIYTGKEFRRGVMSNEEYAASLAFMQKHFKFIYPPEQNFTVNYILELAEQVRESGFEFDGFVLDPYNELEHKRPVGMSETEYVSMILSRLRRYARDKKIHAWLIAHPTKLQKIQIKHNAGDTVEEITKSVYPVATLYDVAGSAHFANKADMGLSIWRDRSDSNAPTQIHSQKVRFRQFGSLGMCNLKFDYKSGKYSE